MVESLMRLAEFGAEAAACRRCDRTWLRLGKKVSSLTVVCFISEEMFEVVCSVGFSRERDFAFL